MYWFNDVDEIIGDNTHKKTRAHFDDSLLVKINSAGSATIFEVLLSPILHFIKP